MPSSAAAAPANIRPQTRAATAANNLDITPLAYPLVGGVLARSCARRSGQDAAGPLLPRFNWVGRPGGHISLAGRGRGSPMSLALATLIYEWQRYLAAIIALGCAGMMVLAMVGLFGGIIK